MTEMDPPSDHLHRLFTQSHDMLAIATDGYLTHVNDAWTTFLGWPAEDLLSRRFLEFVHPDDVKATRYTMRQLMNGIGTGVFRNRLLHLDGTYRTLRWSLQPDDELVFVSARDISIYAELRERAERSEAVATGVLQTAVDPIIVIDVDGVITDANPATSRLFGYDVDQLIGSNVSMLMPEPYRGEHDGYMRRYLREGDPRIIGIGREVEAQRADGSVFAMALAVSEVKTDRDHLFTGVIHDLTERNRQRDELQAANIKLEERVAERTLQLESLLDELRRSNRDLEQFAYIASHDLQTPLRNVRQGLELLDEHLTENLGQRLDDEARELRDLTVSAALRMEQLIQGLLAYSRLDRSGPDGRPVDLGGLAEEVLQQMSVEFGLADTTVELADLPVVNGDEIQLRQLLQNLLQNAFKYRHRERPLKIGVTASQTDDGWLISIGDNGIGIDPEQKQRIFELFRRAHPDYDGMGLGLAICQRIVERHGGDIWVDTGPDGGSVFSFTIPTDLPDETGAAEREPSDGAQRDG